jgi:acetylornithine deacetylase
MNSSGEILAQLVRFASITDQPNGEIAAWIGRFLEDQGIECHRLPSPDGTKVGLLARIGPQVDGGILLSAHMDVVPITGQAWTHDPFDLIAREGKLFGRGACDMKGFLACALTAAKRAASTDLQRPLLLSFSYDEEIGCRGMAHMIGQVIPVLGRPAACIVGEPTAMQIATGHKGKVALRAICTGTPGHSANAPRFVNALQMAARFAVMLDAVQDSLRINGPSDPAYEIDYCTVHVGKMSGGVALNMVPETATVDFEVRYLPEADIDGILDDIRQRALAIGDTFRHPAAKIGFTVLNHYPGLSTDPSSTAVRLAGKALADAKNTKVAYGTEAGFFDRIGIPTVVCGPGSMDQGHQPDEYILQGELDKCDAFLSQLVDDSRRPVSDLLI